MNDTRVKVEICSKLTNIIKLHHTGIEFSLMKFFSRYNTAFRSLTGAPQKKRNI